MQTTPVIKTSRFYPTHSCAHQPRVTFCHKKQCPFLFLHRLARRIVAQTKTWRPWVMCGVGVAASARQFELGETHGEHRLVRYAERRRGVCCAPASERPRRHRVGRLVASTGTEESSSKQRRGVLGLCVARAWPRAHGSLSSGKPTVSTD